MKCILVSSLALLITGCATAGAETQQAKLDQAEKQTEAARADMGRRTEQAGSAFQAVDEVWLGAEKVERVKRHQYPAEFEAPLLFDRNWDMTLHGIAEYIASSHGIPVDLTEDAVEAASGVQRTSPSPAVEGLGDINLPALPAQVRPSGPMPGGQNQFGIGMRISYRGTLRGFLDHIAGRTGTNWRYRDNRIQFYHLDTRVYRLDVLPGKVDLQGTITNLSQGGGATGGGQGGGGAASALTTMSAGSSAQISVTMDQFSAVVDTVKGMLSPKGKVSAAPGMGQIVVTDIPGSLGRVEQYLKEANATAGRQVKLEVQIYAIEGNASNGYNVSLDGVWQTLTSKFGLAFKGGNFNSENNAFGVQILEGPFQGSGLVIDALARQGTMRQLTTASVMTLSGRPIPVQVGEETSYIASSQVSLVPDVGQQITRTVGKITSGFSMTVLPIVTTENEVLLDAQINLSALRELRKVGNENDSTSIEMPLVDSRQMAQSVKLDFGQTLILTGFEQELLRSDATGTGTPGFKLLGGGKNSNRRNTTLVIMITPRAAN